MSQNHKQWVKSGIHSKNKANIKSKLHRALVKSQEIPYNLESIEHFVGILRIILRGVDFWLLDTMTSEFFKIK